MASDTTPPPASLPDDAAASPKPGQFSVVVAVYNVARYLDDFIDSFEAQSYPIDDLDIVLVDDGSTDDSFERLQKWQTQHPQAIRVLTKENGGQASARNLGIHHARNDWLTFADPDDMLDPAYFSSISSYMADSAASDTELFAAHLVYWEEALGHERDGHPLRKRFNSGNRIADLDGFPNVIHLHASSAFFRREVIQRSGLTFDARIRPTFEDGHFVGKYMLQCKKPQIGLVAEARYLYRRRADNSSTMQTSHADPRKYTDVPKYGHLDLLRGGLETYGHVPYWLQNTVLYDIFWYLKVDAGLYTKTSTLDRETCDVFHRLLLEIRSFLTDEAIKTFDVMPVPADIRKSLLLLDQESHIPSNARIEKYDAEAQLALISYTYKGNLPAEEIFIRGRAVEPLHAKITDIVYYQKPLLHRRFLWISASGTVRINLNGQPVEFRGDWASRPNFSLHRKDYDNILVRKQRMVPKKFRVQHMRITTRLKESLRRSVTNVTAAFGKASLEDRALALALHVLPVGRKFEGAWAFMDRSARANDNAEHLYRYVAAERPEINSWFVLQRDSPDWNRLEAEGFRLVAYNTTAWRILMLRAKHLASSHIDDYVVNPLPRERYGPRLSKYTFLQHGVTNNDLATWFNAKDVDLFITATDPERDSIAGDHTRYKFTRKEVRLTGFPRHDRLLLRDRAIPLKEKSSLLVMPTWRKSVAGELIPGTNRRLINPEFRDSEFASQWSSLLNSPRLAEIAKSAGLDVVFMPHPDMEPYLNQFELPSHVRVKSYSDSNVQDEIAKSRLMVTDFSSIAFEIAYLYRPVVYFQFDADDFYGGTQSYRRGYFDFQRDGFGPVAETVDQALSGIESLASPDWSTDTPYLERMERTFPVRDGQNSQRVISSMLELNRPVSYRNATKTRRTFKHELPVDENRNVDARSEPATARTPAS
ncbi:CDP-glycerol glycerophosphotransferase family protein [Saxibacter everestensis]|uniref:CDP-glycerol glycerophosphotransferase family protein n=1 Tax=Saxibacter everestensis TaxID=2909229 RepID=A0ABY8QTK6_9MICO|nr:CDP-glycerol glycerophosphotransferase family protein [Brevibacteriaceae bacterium ZFBP1038]